MAASAAGRAGLETILLPSPITLASSSSWGGSSANSSSALIFRRGGAKNSELTGGGAALKVEWVMERVGSEICVGSGTA